MSEDKNPAFLQGAEILRLAANMSDAAVGMWPAPEAPRRGTLALAAKARESTALRTPAAHTCQQRLRLNFYFDGTGNNRDADVLTQEHSNVVRMFLAARANSETEGVYSFYIPGLGTYFPDIGDRGETAGKAFGRRGEQRLQWALNKLQERRVMAHNLCGIDIAVFGFSRGAALARAFANRIQKLCEAGRSGTVLKGTTVAVDIYFMGLWDTVASTGLPKSFNNQSVVGLIGEAIRTEAGGSEFAPTTRLIGRDVRSIAYGRPGADPAPAHLFAWADGHLDWGSEMAIAPIVSAGVHMIAGHEIRNSFPVDSTLQGNLESLAFAGQEFVYPGAHSNVGGGYRPGEGGRSWKSGQQLSLITLQVMYQKARAAGVPVRDLNDPLVVPAVRLAFAQAVPSDPHANHAAAAEFAELQLHWNAYMNYCGRGARPVGQWLLAHMKAYYAWRFWNIKANRSARASGEPTQTERSAGPIEVQSKHEQAALDRQIDAQESSPALRQARDSTAQARSRLQFAEQQVFHARNDPSGWMSPLTAEQAQAVAQARSRRIADARAQVEAARRELQGAQQAQSAAEDPLRRLEARKATLPSHGSLSRNAQQYDDRLYADAEVLARDKPRRRELRPHYKALVEAWEDEFVDNKGLIDARVMRFFDHYVHDSLADFNRDATLPSDPRVLYVGGDERAQFAVNVAPREPASAQAA